MESKQIFAVILAVLGVVLLIGIMRTVSGADKTDSESSTEITSTTPAPITMPPTTTDYWDYLRQQQETTDPDAAADETTVTTLTTTIPEENTDQTETTVPVSPNLSDETAPYIMSDAPIVATDDEPAVTSAVTTVTEAPPVTARTGYTLHIG